MRRSGRRREADPQGGSSDRTRPYAGPVRLLPRLKGGWARGAPEVARGPPPPAGYVCNAVRTRGHPQLQLRLSGTSCDRDTPRATRQGALRTCGSRSQGHLNLVDEVTQFQFSGRIDTPCHQVPVGTTTGPSTNAALDAVPSPLESRLHRKHLGYGHTRQRLRGLSSPRCHPPGRSLHAGDASAPSHGRGTRPPTGVCLHAKPLTRKFRDGGFADERPQPASSVRTRGAIPDFWESSGRSRP